MAQVKLAYENVLEQNLTLLEMNRWCDSVRQAHVNVIVQLDDLLMIKEEKIVNLKKQNEVSQDMFQLANDQIRKENRLKWVFVGTTVLMAGFLTLALL